MAVMFGSMQMGQAMAMAPDYGEAMLAAKRVFYLLQKTSKCDPEKKEGRTLDKVHGRIELKNVHFTYPHRPDMKVLKGINLTIEPGESLALVGQSGCGKSTMIQLIERFYDPDEGEILLDGVNIRELNVNWLRKNLGFVQQEPVLMNRSIADNIRQGQADVLGDVIEANYEHSDKMIHEKIKDDSVKGKTISGIYPINDVVDCAKSAHIDDFIQNQAHGYETNVGRGGGSLSGEQKQRVAIARTLMMEPSILLLDEATSALDNESERKVNEALDAARKNRSVIMIAHRLSTVRTADRIACIDFGQVVETGTHDELIAKQSVYYNLVKAQ